MWALETSFLPKAVSGLWPSAVLMGPHLFNCLRAEGADVTIPVYNKVHDHIEQTMPKLTDKPTSFEHSMAELEGMYLDPSVRDDDSKNRACGDQALCQSFLPLKLPRSTSKRLSGSVGLQTRETQSARDITDPSGQLCQ